MKVLLCTPYRQDPNVVSGGINVWGNNVWQFYQDMSPKDVELDIVSYDRIYNVQEDTSAIKRIFYGIKDYSCAISRTKQMLKDGEDYDVLHLCTSAQLGLFKDYVVIKEAHRRGVKVVLHLHFGRVPSMFEKGGFECRLFKKVAALADVLIAIDPTSYNTLIKHGFKNTYYLPNPLALNIIKQIEKECTIFKRVKNKILYVGHVIPSKGVYELVKACVGIDTVDLYLVGSLTDDMRSSLEEIAKDRNNGEWLKLRGGIPHDEVIKEMLSCCIFVLPSYTEGFPNVILEAMACGCPIVATDVGAIPEMLGKDENSGIIVKPKDTVGLKHALLSMLGDMNFAQKSGNNARSRVKDLYTMPKVWGQLVNVWKKC